MNGAHNGSPLVKAAVEAGCQVKVAAIFPGAGRDFERWLKDSNRTTRWCPHCGEYQRRFPDPSHMTEKFRASKRNFEAVETL
jgi:hypothetical protein